MTAYLLMILSLVAYLSIPGVLAWLWWRSTTAPARAQADTLEPDEHAELAL